MKEIHGKIINQKSPVVYRQIAKKLLDKYPYRKITREQSRRILGLCFKIGTEKSKVLKELEDFGLLIFVSKKEYYINYQEIEEND